jgi:hypothetical protein
VREQNRWADLREEGGHGLRDHAWIERARVRRHRAEELVKRLRLAIELDIVEVVRPLADPELVEEELIERGGLDRRCDRAVAGSPATRLIDEKHREATAQEDRLEAFTAVGCGLPTARRLVGAMKHHDRQRLGVLRDLIKGVEMIAVERLPFGSRAVVVVGSGSSQDGPADGEAALLLND